jgi:Bacterial pre-peptidase C-terminal domain
MRFKIFMTSPILLLLATQALAEQRMLEYALPRGGTRGTTVEITLHGQYLKDPREVMFYGPGLKAVAVERFKPDTDVKARLEIAPDCPVGEHVLRLRTATALSEAVTFWVSPFPTVAETEKKIGENDTIAKAQAVPLNSTVEGQILPGEQMDRDVYRVELQQGQRLSVEVESVRLGTLHYGGENDLGVRILDSAGKELAHADDSALYVQDPVLALVAPRAGSYFVEIAQQIYYAPRMAYYRAHIGTFTRPLAIYPAGGQAGTTVEARILGDPAGERTESIALPRKTGNFDYFAGAAGEQPPSANVLRVSAYPNVLKAEGDGPTEVPALPAALNGILAKRGDVQTFRFSAKKGESWKIRVYARTLGSPMDPKIWIRAANSEKYLLQADDCKLAELGNVSMRGTWYTKDTLDPLAIFKVPADGQYILGVLDTRGKAGPEHVYRVEIEPVHDLLYTHITQFDGYQIPRMVGLIVPQGNRWTLDVQLAQGFGNTFKGDVELEALGLPPGVKMIAPRFTKGVTRMPVQFVADAKAEQQSALIELRARPVDKSAKLESASRQGFALVNRPGELPWHFVFLDKFALAVTQPAPFDIQLEKPSIPLGQNGELLLKVKINRHGDFKGPVEIQTDWLPPGVSKGGTVTIAAGKDEADYKIQANAKAGAGVYQIAINATTTGGDAFSGVGRVRASSPFVELKISDPYLAIDLKHAAVERGQRGQMAGAVRQNKAFPGTATVELKRLPRGVKQVGKAQITAKDTQVVFEIEADQDALMGLYKEIACEVTVTENGQAVHQQTGSGVLRVDAARTVAVTR